MKPGVDVRCRVASITRVACAPASVPTATMRPSRTPMSAGNHGLPVPSSTRPLRISRSNACAPGWAPSIVVASAATRTAAGTKRFMGVNSTEIGEHKEVGCLFFAQRNERIDTRCTPRGQVAREQCDGSEDSGGRGKTHGIQRRHAEEQRPQRTRDE